MTIAQQAFSDMFSFSRDGEASFVQDNNITFVQNDIVREVFDGGSRIGILVESPSYNFLSDSLNPKDQTITLHAGDYVFSGYGGDVSISGNDTIILTGTPIPLTFTEETTLTIVPESSVMAFQLEEGHTPTSIIRTPVGSGMGRSQEYLTTPRTNAFSRNSGTVLGQIHIPFLEANAVYFSMDGMKIETDGDVNLMFTYEGQSIEYLNDVNGVIKYAIVYDAFQGYVRCYLNEEVGEISLSSYFIPQMISLFGDDSPKRMILSRYEYRPKALTNTQVSRMFGYDFELSYDFEVSPEQVNNWATLIFGSSLYGFEL